MTEEMTKYKDKWCQEAYERGKAEATKELQEENKQLKKKLVQTQDAVTMQMYTNKANKEQSEIKIAELEAYDASDAVNGFIIRTDGSDVTEWLDTYKRNNAFRAIESAKKLGDESISFAIGDIPVTLTVTTAEIYLARVEKYAVTCTNVTVRHKAAINALDTVEDVEAYDFTVGYPQRLTFEI